MRHVTVVAGLLSVITLLCAPGCCETSNRPPAPVKNDCAPLLVESITPAPSLCPEPASLPKCSGEVQGEFVYNLGMGVISNTESVRLAGGADKPSRFCLPGGVPGRCTNPVPASYYEAVRAGVPAPREAKQQPSFAPPSAVIPPAPDAVAWEPGIAASGYCPPVGCVVPVQTSAVCAPEFNCFTLPEDQASTGPELIVPAQVTYEAVVASPEVAASPEIVSAPEQGFSSSPAAPMPQIPTTDSIPELAIPTGGSSEKYEVIIPPLTTQPESGIESVRPMPPAEAPATPAASLPPVPEVTNTEATLEAAPLPPPEGLDTSSLQEVKLPPSLN